MTSWRSGFTWLMAVASMSLLACGGQSSNPSESTSGSTQTGQILYVISGSTVATYAVDTQSRRITLVEPPVSLSSLQYFIQFVPSSDDRFLFILSSDAPGNERLSEYTTDSSGAPQMPAAQVGSVPFLSQFTLHPSGRFAYAMEVIGPSGSISSGSGAQYTANIRLLQIAAHTGHFREDPTGLASYGPSYDLPASLFGLSKDGSHLYIRYQGSSGAAYRMRSVNANTGGLGSELGFYGEAGLWNATNVLAIGTKLIIDTYRNPLSSASGYLDVVPNPPGPTMIRCTAAMLAACQSATNVQLDPSGQYLFLTNPGTQQVQIARINLTQHKIELTGSTIPMTAETPGYFFSPDGNVVYALLATDNNLHVYSFDSDSGVLTDTGIFLVPPASNAGFCPARRS
jgi:Lactonase, 7-bladed beta-propeller